MYDLKPSSSDSYNRQNLDRGATNLIEKDRKPSQKHEDSHWYSKEVVVQFRPDHGQEAMKTDHPNYRSLSSNSRTEAIVRGQWELMEMVKNMPDESSYELSLKDMVEHHRLETQTPQTGDISAKNLHQRAVGSKKIERNKSLDHNKGLFLNMVLPFSLKFKKKTNNSVKVSPKPEGIKGGGGGGGGGERDWWKKNSDNDSRGGRSSNTGGRRKRNGFLRGCWTIFKSRRSKSAE